jgi:hypothetical protein
MGALDSNGIWIYDENEDAAPFSTMLNRLGESVSSAVSHVAPASAWTSGAPWLASGYTSNGLQVRKFGDMVFWRGRLGVSTNWGNANATNTVATGIPAEYRPAAEMGWINTAVLNSAGLVFQVRITAGGTITVRSSLATRTEDVYASWVYLAA